MSRSRQSISSAAGLVASLALGCATTGPAPSTEPDRPTPVSSTEASADTTTDEQAPAEQPASVRSDDLETQVAELQATVADLQLRLLESEAQAAALQEALDAAIREAVRSKGKLQSVESRAEAASTIAEAEIALNARRQSTRSNPRFDQAAELLAMGAAEFDNENYGGALYLATHAKDLLSESSALDAQAPTRTNEEVPFYFSLPLRVSRSSNVRSGPGTSFEVLFALEEGAEVTGHAYDRQWVRISLDDGRTGWIYSTLVDSRSRQGSG